MVSDNPFTKPIPISQIITHHHADFDEAVGIVVLQDFGREMFPGIEHARITFHTTGASLVNGLTWQEHLKRGGLLLGIGGGPFDEHPRDGKKRIPGESSASLVAKFLGVSDHPCLGRLLQETIRADNDRVPDFNFANLMHVLYNTGQEAGVDEHANALLTLTNAILVCRRCIMDQTLFMEAKRFIDALPDDGKNIRLIRRHPEERRMLCIRFTDPKTENPKIKAAAFHLGAPLLVQQKVSGHVQIFSNSQQDKKEILKLHGVTRELRIAELRAGGMSKKDIVALDQRALRAEGKHPLVPEWFFEIRRSGAQIFNGSNTTPNAPVTRIPFEEIVRITQEFAIPITD